MTGATGKTCSAVTTELLKAGYLVRALVHREDGRSAGLRALGAEIGAARARYYRSCQVCSVSPHEGYFCHEPH